MADPQALNPGPRINPYLEQGPVQWELPQGDQQPDARPPAALQTGAPPPITSGVTPPAAAQPDFDDDGLYQQAEQIEEDTYQKNVLDAAGRKPLLGGIS